MKILFVAEYAYPHKGGAEKLIQTLSESLVQKKHEVAIITSKLDEKSVSNEIIHGVYYIRTPILRFLPPRFSFFFSVIPYLVKYAKEYDVIQNFPYMSTFWVWLIGSLYNKPTVLTVFEVGGKLWTKVNSTNRFLYLCFRIYEKFIFSLSFDQIVGISRYTYNNLRVFTSHNDEKLSYIYPGFDSKRWNPAKFKKEDVMSLKSKLGLKGKWVYFFFGRPGVNKGIDVLMRSIKIISKKIPQSHALVIASHQEKYELSRLVHLIISANVEKNITMMDSIEYDQLPYYAMVADCIVLPSLIEGFGYSVLEACTLGKPVVVSEVGAIPEVAFGKVHYFKPQDSNDLAHAVYNIYKSKFQILPKKSFPISRFVKQYIELYTNLYEK